MQVNVSHKTCRIIRRSLDAFGLIEHNDHPPYRSISIMIKIRTIHLIRITSRRVGKSMEAFKNCPARLSKRGRRWYDQNGDDDDDKKIMMTIKNDDDDENNEKNDRRSSGVRRYAPTKENPVVPYLSINQHQSASFSNNQHQSASISINKHLSASISTNQPQSESISINQNKSASIRINQHKSASCAISQHQSASVSINQHISININQHL